MKLVIIGGVAAGATAAARARRLDEAAEIVVFERGEYVSFANCGLPYHLGGVIPKRESLLLNSPAFFKRRFNIEVRTRCEVVAIDRERHLVHVLDHRSGETFVEPYDKLVITTGASPAVPPIKGVPSELATSLWTIPDMDRILMRISGKQEITVVGAGFVGLEVAENLLHRGFKVRVVEFAPQILMPLDQEMTTPLVEELRSHGCELMLNTGVTALAEREGRAVLTLTTGAEVVTDYVILATGVKPNSELAAACGLTLGARGGIVTQETMQTSDPDIYAAGDVCEIADPVLGGRTQIPLAAPANKQARVAVDQAVKGFNATYAGALGTSVVKIFDFTAASTGQNEKMLQRAHVPYVKIYAHALHHVAYYPGGKMIHMKLLFSPDDGRILGAQACGKAGVARRIDVIATAIKARMKVEELVQLDLCYAPPYGGAKDPVTLLGTIGENVRRGMAHFVYAEELTSEDYVVDIREEGEVMGGVLPDAHVITLDALREHIAELPRDRRIVVYCRVGQRGHTAEQILRAHGLNAWNLAGGYLTYYMVFPKPSVPQSPLPTQKMTSTSSFTTSTTSSKTTYIHKPTSFTVTPPETRAGKATEQSVKRLDLRGLPCPGPLLMLRDALTRATPGTQFELLFEEAGFANDLRAFCKTTHTEFLRIERGASGYVAEVQKGNPGVASCPPAVSQSCGLSTQPKEVTLVLFSGDLDKALAAMIIANGYAALGCKVTIFCTFWGLGLLRKSGPLAVQKTVFAKIMGAMLPQGANRLKLSKLNLGGLGTMMMKQVMAYQQVKPLPELLADAQKAGVQFLACEMSMNILGIRPEELIDGVELAGVGSFASRSLEAQSTLFI